MKRVEQARALVPLVMHLFTDEVCSQFTVLGRTGTTSSPAVLMVFGHAPVKTTNTATPRVNT